MKLPEFADSWEKQLQELQRLKKRTGKPFPWEAGGDGLEGLGFLLVVLEQQTTMMRRIDDSHL